MPSPFFAVPRAMVYVYILQSEAHPDRRYIGYSADLKQRVSDHNNGKNPSTRGFETMDPGILCRLPFKI